MENQSMAKELLSAMRSSNKRQFVIIILLIVALVATNGYWIWYNAQWEYETVETTTYEVESSDNGNAIINETGEVNISGNGEENESQSENTDTEKMIEVSQ